MNVIETSLPGVIVLEPDHFSDARGFFMETYQKERYQNHGVKCDFVQDNLSFSVQGTLRGLHYQYPNEQAKLVQVIQGEVFDVAVDIRRDSNTFGKWTGEILSEKNKRQLFIPEGFAHGFCVTSQTAIFLYKCSNYYSPEDEYGILWSDPEIGIKWPIDSPIISEKDAYYPLLQNIDAESLPSFINHH